MEKFKCAICGKEYATVEERMRCEKTCCEAQKRGEEEKRLKAMQLERKERREDILKSAKSLREKVDRFCAEYGAIHIGGRDWFAIKSLFDLLW